MLLPFTRDQFVADFADYNEAMWLARLVAPLIGAGIAAQVLQPSRAGDRLIGAGLALMWLWTGVAYHAVHFSRINPLAWIFALLFVAQGLLLLRSALQPDRLVFGFEMGPSAWLGWALVTYAIVGYPLVGFMAGQRMAELPAFGITPCPVTLFTLGLLLLTTAPVPRALLVIPWLWSLIGGSAAVLLSMPQDWALALGLVVVPWILVRDRTRDAVADTELMDMTHAPTTVPSERR